MKKTLLFFLILIVILIYGKSSLVDANTVVADEEQFEKEKIIIENLFKQRSKLWNNIYEKNMKTNEWIQQIKNTVTEPLLSFDIEAFEEASKYPTDIDKVLNLEIVNIENVTYQKNDMQAKIKILWIMQGLSSKYEEEIDYIVILKKENNHWKICDYYIDK
ncbi:hypothetical protein FQB35_05825 [Crassaminicella thermophila]|uniref:Uncharacterized protein n=1 Tax=Crassaminicella thermophila TaxID=2599308 RepID=A0A5C0SDS3_CRATE|nr:hypothetical protein [Crassaminicella thermophila]QEK11927.1 hypothetical protein FQB35_05825 [Crassaminicella thermophila]